MDRETRFPGAFGRQLQAEGGLCCLLRTFRLRVSGFTGALVFLSIALSACQGGRLQETGVSQEDVERGAELYQAQCLSCHGGPEGRGMMDIPPSHGAGGHTWHHADCQLEDIVLNGSGEMGQMMRQMMGRQDAPVMPVFRDVLTKAEVEAILTYIKTLWTNDQRTAQARITRDICRT